MAQALLLQPITTATVLYKQFVRGCSKRVYFTTKYNHVSRVRAARVSVSIRCAALMATATA
eukprot:9110-Heterococcus_DN1.PRE.2